MGKSVKIALLKRQATNHLQQWTSKVWKSGWLYWKKKSHIQSELKLSYQKTDKILVEIFTCFFLKLTKMRLNHKLW